MKSTCRTFWLIVAVGFCCPQAPAEAAPKIEVTGIMLTSTGATAIINGKCYAVNDTVGGGKITAIEKGNVTVRIKDKSWDFPVSSQGANTASKKKSLSALLDRTKNRLDDFKKKANRKLSRK